MGRYGQLVMGPAGAGKSTYCATMQKHCESTKRSAHVVNLDPAAEIFEYAVSIGMITSIRPFHVRKYFFDGLKALSLIFVFSLFS